MNGTTRLPSKNKVTGGGCTLRIFCVDHRPGGAPAPFGLTPFGVGKNRGSGMLTDAAGETIASLNPFLNETTALWWVWRHREVRQGVAFVGFCHYRRLLLFRPVLPRVERVASRLGRCAIALEVLTNVRAPVDEEAARQVLEKSGKDGFLPCPVVFNARQGGVEKSLEQAVRRTWRDRLLSRLAEDEPELAAFVHDLWTRGSWFYPANLFVARTRLFEAMGERLFPSLLDVCNQWRAEAAPEENPRTPGYLAEFLIGSYWRWLEVREGAQFLHGRQMMLTAGGGGIGWLVMSGLGYRFLPEWAAQGLRHLAGRSLAARWFPAP